MYVTYFVPFQTIWIKSDSIRASMCDMRAAGRADRGKDEDEAASGSPGRFHVVDPSHSVQHEC